MKSEQFLGCHSEWNLGSPGGWDYQRMAQVIGRFSWERIKKAAGIDIELDFDHTVLNPLAPFAEMLLRAHKKRFGKEKPFIVLVAEEETLDKVGENIHFIEHINKLPGVEGRLVGPSSLELKDGNVCVEGKKATLIFMDFNNNVLLKMGEKYDIAPLMAAIRNGLVVNPRGMEPIGAKGVFEAITGEYKDLMSETTFKRTPWTRQFYKRRTDGPGGEDIPDLVKWAKDNWQNVILKPVHGYSGKGIIIGFKEADIDKSVKRALDAGDYIIQPLIPTKIWAEEFPWIDKEKGHLFIKRWQTDFRCFVTDRGIIGFVTRFGGIPTNVGCGGGVQPTAILRSRIPVKDAIRILNDAIIGLGYDYISSLQDEIDKLSIEIGNVYLLGPLMSTLRPRLITPLHVKQIKEYGENLWRDAMKLEELWLAGKLSKYTQISDEEAGVAKMAPWRGSIALIAADGLFGFGGSL
ncbi:MAG: hypothetical protein HQ593_05805 [Candidatus Omnitrophica bacterium]|nr:hypothetical protein [Candidatus Omnitrophota bacterium]